MLRERAKKYHIALILGISGLVFFICFSFLNWAGPLRFNSPDETANFYFISEFSEEWRMWAYEPANYYLEDMVHPRSIQIVDDFLVPGGFIGMPLLYGLIAKVITPGLTIYLTPLFSVLAGLAWFGIVRKYFNKWAAFASTYLVWSMPAWWYYSARGFLPNVLFISLAMISAYFALVRPMSRYRKKKEMAKSFVFDNIDWLIAGAFLGISLMVRPAEILWMAGVGILLLLFNIKKINWTGLIIFLAVTIIALIPMFVLNNSLYGSPISTGYQSINSQIIIEDTVEEVKDDQGGMAVEQAIAEPQNQYFNIAKTILLPFDFIPGNILKNFIDYHIEFQYWYTIAWMIGLAFFLIQLFRKKITWPMAQFVLIFGFVSAWLIIVYGSWQFFDNINVFNVTIGNSYLRYWLPSFILATPVIGYLIYMIGKVMKFKALQVIFALIFLSAFGAMGFYTTLFGEDEGLMHVRRHLWRYEWISDRVLEITEDNSIIITDRSDKIFFPERRIVYPLRSEATYNILSKMFFVAPTYYYGVSLTEEAVDHLNQEIFNPKNLKMEPLELFDNETLYIFYYELDEDNS